jgi:triosephosphate isomerase
MRTPIIAGNWKMHNTLAESLALVEAMRSSLDDLGSVDSVVCPPFVSLSGVAAALQSSRVAVGAQDMHFAEQGAYTGEIAPGMLVGLCQYVILGHSERRGLFGETDENVNRKVKAALAHGLTPIICVGETEAQYDAGNTDAVVREQVTAALHGVSGDLVSSLVVAYEPIWAIGTGKAATAADASRVIGGVVRATVAELLGQATAQAVRIQYGGSTKPANIAQFMEQPEIDGALVGGASLQAESFVDMVRITAQLRG